MVSILDRVQLHVHCVVLGRLPMQWVQVRAVYAHPVHLAQPPVQRMPRLARIAQAVPSARLLAPTVNPCATNVLLASTIQGKAAMRVMHAEIAHPEKYPAYSVRPSVPIVQTAHRQMQGTAIATRVQRETT